MGDQREFDEFYIGTRVHLLRQLTMMTGDAEQAADVLQEAYARAWQRWRRVATMDEPLGLGPHRRLADRHQPAPTFARGRGSPPAVLRPRGGARARLPIGTKSLDLRAALRLLSPEHRRALVLYEMAGLSVTQVAAETGAAEGTVKSRLARARAALAAALGPDYLTQGVTHQAAEGRLT